MSIYDTDLWKLMEAKAREDRLYDYVTRVREICDFGIERSVLIRDTFPLYTLHNETHIHNVLDLMHKLLGSRVSDLTRDEAAMLVICACCHDVGMSYSEEEKRELLNDRNRIDRYLSQHTKEYNRAYAMGSNRPVLDESMQRSFFRSIHHERVQDLLCRRFDAWPRVLVGRVNRDDIVRVCRSHGEGIDTLRDLNRTSTIDLRMCAVLLRLADILDFDDSRAPKTIYEYCGFDALADKESQISAMEWKKHQASVRFRFPRRRERKRAYYLDYSASCDDPQVEQGVRRYLDWVDKELRDCREELGLYVGNWQDLVLPRAVRRHIISEGYESGSFRFVLDQDKVLDLLVGNDLYEDQSVFVRELIQNAIDAVRTRQELDETLRHSPDWKPCIRIHTWTDDEGYHWFRIEDNGVGMTKDTMLNHLLKVGSSYYASDDFEYEKRRHHASADYTPISRFGIGILSCFMNGDGAARVELSTKHFEGGTSLRLRIDATSGLYRLCNHDASHHPGPMQGVTDDEKREYLSDPGTVVAVRTNLYASGAYGGFKEIVDKYVAFPPVPIRFEDDEGTVFDYPTEQELVAGACGIDPDEVWREGAPRARVVDLPVPIEAVEQIKRVWPKFVWPQDVKVQLGCLSLGAYAASQYVSGAAVVARVVGDFPTFVHRFGSHEIEMQARVDLEPVIPNAASDGTIRLRVLVRPTNTAYSHSETLFTYKKFLGTDDMSALIRQRDADGDACLATTLDALRKSDVMDGAWRTTMMARFGLGEEGLDQEVERARNIIGGHTGLTPEAVDLAVTLSRMHEWRFAICDLASFDWYMSWFGGVYARTGHSMLVAHNGIACGSAEGLFCDERGSSHCVAAILLLEDKYRPDLGLARDGIRGYPLETQLVLELMRRRMQAEGFHLGEDSQSVTAGYHLLSAAAYEDVLADNRALAHDLTLAIEGEGEVRIDELAGVLPIQGLAVPRKPILMWDDPSRALAQLYQRFCWAHAQRMFTIKDRFGTSSSRFSWEGDTQLCPKEADDLPQGYRLFPPAFFALPLSPEDTCLTESIASWRRCINAAHPLARFLLHNATTLHDRTPGILMEFTRCLAEDEGEQLVRTVNMLVRRLRKLRNSPVRVPADLKELSPGDLS